MIYLMKKDIQLFLGKNQIISRQHLPLPYQFDN